MLKEFRKFIARGNVVDLAVGIMIGTAFASIVNSLVSDIIMPPLGLLFGEVDFSQIALTIRAATADTGAVTIGIGVFINVCLRFLIIAFVVFLLVRGINRLRDRLERKEDEKPPQPAPERPRPTRADLLLAAIKELTAAVREMRKP